MFHIEALAFSHSFFHIENMIYNYLIVQRKTFFDKKSIILKLYCKNYYNLAHRIILWTLNQEDTRRGRGVALFRAQCA